MQGDAAKTNKQKEKTTEPSFAQENVCAVADGVYVSRCA